MPPRLLRLIPAFLGLTFGLGLGLAWWFLWGCKMCDPGGAPEAKVIFTAVVGMLLGEFLGKEHVKPRPE